MHIHNSVYDHFTLIFYIFVHELGFFFCYTLFANPFKRRELSDRISVINVENSNTSSYQFLFVMRQQCPTKLNCHLNLFQNVLAFLVQLTKLSENSC